MATLNLNPIIAREIRTRWRGRNSFLLVLGYTALVSIVVGWVYAYIVDFSSGKTMSPGAMAGAGHTLFVIVTILQSFAWMLLAPTLTATSIAGERERGLLEGLQLSPLTSWQIVWGKLLSSLTYGVLIIAVSLPITAISFLLGGVSPEEMCIALLLHMVAAITGASVGLLWSARSRRANIALRVTIFFIFAWLVCSGIGVTNGFGPAMGPGSGSWLSISTVWWLLGLFVMLSNPALVAIGILTNRGSGMFATLAGIGVPLWMLGVGAQLMLSIVSLWLATRALRRPFAEQYWIESHRSKRKEKSVGEKAEPQQASSIWWEIPLVGHWPFTNPVMQREVRGKFRMRQAPLWAIIGEGLLGLVVLYYYLRTLWGALFEPGERETIWQVLAYVTLLVVMLAVAVMGASVFTRERETGTWEALNLSLLTPVEIIRGKLLAPLLACTVYSLPLWPLLLPCIHRVFSSGAGNSQGISLTQATGTLLVIGSTAWCYTAFGMLCSWRARSTATAVGSTLGGIFLGLTFVPVVLTLLFNRVDFQHLYHPFITLARVQDTQGHGLLTGIYSSVILFGIGGLFLEILRESIQANIREHDLIVRGPYEIARVDDLPASHVMSTQTRGYD